MKKSCLPTNFHNDKYKFIVLLNFMELCDQLTNHQLESGSPNLCFF